MVETIKTEWRTARKQHECDLCCKKIEIGEKYHYALMKYDGEFYEFKEHEKCNFISAEIWDYCEPDEGMTEDDFHEGVTDICRDFVCPFCEKYKNGDCDESYCLDKVYDLLQEYELYMAWKDGCFTGWKVRKRPET